VALHDRRPAMEPLAIALLTLAALLTGALLPLIF
jgi:hypothetical protein